MLIWIENLCVFAIVGTAAVYLWLYFSRMFRPSKSGGCNSGSGCPKCGTKG